MSTNPPLAKDAKSGGETMTGNCDGSELSSTALEQKMWDCYNFLMTCPDVNRLRKILARTELFRMTTEVPGDIVECGVLKGAGFMHLLKLRHIFLPGTMKRVVGFDMFESMPTFQDENQQKEMGVYFNECGFTDITPEYLNELGKTITEDSNLFEFVKGDICTTAKEYVDKHPGFRISFLNLDLDVAEPTLGALQAFWPRVARGGVVVFDEYAVERWSESQAVDEFFADKPEVVIKSLPWACTPTAYCIKP